MGGWFTQCGWIKSLHERSTITNSHRHGVITNSPVTILRSTRQFALVSRHFYYFGAKAIVIPGEFDLEKKGPGFRRHFDQADIDRFIEWLERTYKPGKHGEPCYREPSDEPKGSKRCESSC
jgi:hypothetical protein